MFQVSNTVINEPWLFEYSSLQRLLTTVAVEFAVVERKVPTTRSSGTTMLQIPRLLSSGK